MHTPSFTPASKKAAPMVTNGRGSSTPNATVKMRGMRIDATTEPSPVLMPSRKEAKLNTEAATRSSSVSQYTR